MIIHRKSMVYYLKANGKVESTNRERHKGLGLKVSFCIVGLSYGIQNFNMPYTFQPYVETRYNSSFGIWGTDTTSINTREDELGRFGKTKSA